jgi:hypothetical protein
MINWKLGAKYENTLTLELEHERGITEGIIDHFRVGFSFIASNQVLVDSIIAGWNY